MRHRYVSRSGQVDRIFNRAATTIIFVQIVLAFGPHFRSLKATAPDTAAGMLQAGRATRARARPGKTRPESDEAKEVEEREGAASKEKGGRQTTRSECGTAQTIFAVRILENRWRLMNMMRCRSHAPEVQTGKAKGRHGALKFGTHHQVSFAC